MDNVDPKKILWRRGILRVYVNGFIVMAIAYIAWRIVLASPLHEMIDNPFLVALLTFLVIVAVPPLLGGFVIFAVNPVLGRWNTWSELVSLQDRLVSELSRTGDPPVALVNWPSESIRSVGLITSEFSATESGNQMAVVYIPAGPRAKSGYLRVVPKKDLEFINWSFKDFQVFQLTAGSINPSSPDTE